jgi:5-methylcytosine-specific restriction endonuclease McrA
MYCYEVESVWNKEKKVARQKVIKYIGKTITNNKIEAKKVFQRDNYKCNYCGATTNLTVDHIIPLSKKVDNSISNLQTLCLKCNQKKGNT